MVSCSPCWVPPAAARPPFSVWIAGFNSIEGGDIFFNEKRINDMDPSKRNIGMVFQNYRHLPEPLRPGQCGIRSEDRKWTRRDQEADR